MSSNRIELIRIILNTAKQWYKKHMLDYNHGEATAALKRGIDDTLEELDKLEAEQK